MFKRAEEKCWEIFNRYYKNVPSTEDIYRQLIKKYVAPGAIVFDAGCGRHLHYVRFVAPLARVTLGGDLVESFATVPNHSCCAVMRTNLHSIPLRDNSITTIICRSVFEHLPNPLLVLREFNRILNYQGLLIFSTPNLFDYVSIISKLTNHRMHQLLLHRLLGWEADDVFPTFYRFNTEPTVRRLMHAAGFACKELLLVSQYPAYLMFSPAIFRLGILYEKLIRQHDFLRMLRGSIVGVFEKTNELEMEPLHSRVAS